MLRDQRGRRLLRLRGRQAVDAAEMRETVRARYAAAAIATTDPAVEAGCCAPAGAG